MKIENKGNKVVLVIPDLHCPFQHPDTYNFLDWMACKYKPTDVVCLGDEVDGHSLSDYDKNPDGLSAGDELMQAIEALNPLYKMFPDVKVCTSNHTSRPYRKAFKHGIPKAFLKDYKDFLQSPPGWHWKDNWEVDGVIYEHGESFTGQNAALKAALGNMQSTVIGHVHSFAGIQYSANQRHLVFGFNAGCLIDTKSYAFAYGKNFKSKPIIGAGVVNRGVPIFIPMLLDPSGRWLKRRK